MQNKNRLASHTKNKLRKFLDRTAMILLVVICIVAFYIAVILAETPKEEGTAVASLGPQPTLVPQQPAQISTRDQLPVLIASFPAPVLAMQEGAGVTLTGGLINDLAFEGAFARVVTLTYQTTDGQVLTLQSIYPSNAFALLDSKGYSLQGQLIGMLSGMTAVRMESETGLRLHVRGEKALYALSAPKMEEDLFTALTRQAQLIQVEQ